MLSRRLSRVLVTCKGTYLDRPVLSRTPYPPTCRLCPTTPPQSSPHRLLHHSRSQRTHRLHSMPRLAHCSQRARRVQGAANGRRWPTCSAWSNHCRPCRDRLCDRRCCRLNNLYHVLTFFWFLLCAGVCMHVPTFHFNLYDHYFMTLLAHPSRPRLLAAPLAWPFSLPPPAPRPPAPLPEFQFHHHDFPLVSCNIRCGFGTLNPT